MEKTDFYIHISQLIAREVNYELNDDEKQELKNWLNSSKDNLELYNRIRNRNRFLNWDEEFHQVDRKKGWEKVHVAINPNRRVKMLKEVLRYAAVIMIPLFLSGVGYYFYTNKGHLSQQEYKITKMNQKQPKARLILADGSKVNLDSEGNIELKEKDGTLIEKDAGKLKYQAKLNQTSKVLYNTVEIPKGADYQLFLADGTKVYMNSMSSLKFPTQFTGKTREVELTGEAYFEVMKDKDHPFLVNALGTKIEVLGTSFNVKAYDDEEEVITTLVEGSVKVKTVGLESKSLLLKPGEQAIANDLTGEITTHEVDVSLYTSWKEGVFQFKSQRLEDIMNELARWYDIKVFFMNPSVKEYCFGGHFNRDEDITSIMEMFESTRKVDVKVNGKTILISAK